MGRVCDNVLKLFSEIKESVTPEQYQSLRIMAVTKNQTIESMEQARVAGLTLFGENRVQEFFEKEAYFREKNLEVHLIGHLQTNKVKQAVGKFNMIQSVDSIRLAELINAEAKNQGIIQDILLEVNIGKEDNKFGFFAESIIENLLKIRVLDNLRVCGLMTIPPIGTNEENIMHFRMMKRLFVDICDKNIDNIYMKTLSMGMTADFKQAIREGSNMIRLGTAIFG